MKGTVFLALKIFVFALCQSGLCAEECSFLDVDGKRLLQVSQGVSCYLTVGTYDAWTFDVNGTLEVRRPSTSSNASLILQAANTIRIGSAGKIVSDATGYEARAGPGAGNAYGSGAGHGGRGGHRSFALLTSTESLSYGNVYVPHEVGSGGGGTCGGAGGGAIHLRANVSVIIDGVVSVNGGDANAGNQCGGGSGGSILIETDHILGSGFLAARGGKGHQGGGGGAGGRISFKYRVSNFVGESIADGGITGSSESQLGILSMFSSSSYNTSFSATYGNLDYSTTRSWRSSTTDKFPWLEARLNNNLYVTAIETRGDPSGSYYVTSYTIEYYNTTTNAWTKAAGTFLGNINNNGIVRRNFPRPVYTSRLRVIPANYTGSIASMAIRFYGYNSYSGQSPPTGDCSSVSTGGAGGPGTVFYGEMGVGVGRLIVDNLGKNPHVVMASNCSKFDIQSQGAAAWILTSSLDLDEIILRNGAHLVIATNISVSEVVGDVTTVVHGLPGVSFTIGRTLDANCYVYQSGILSLAADSDVHVSKWLFVDGTLQFNGLVRLTISGNLTLVIQNFTTSHLKINPYGVMTVFGSGHFPLQTRKFECLGQFKADLVDILCSNDTTNSNSICIEEFFVGPQGLVSFNPISSEEYIGESIDIRGNVSLGKHISIINPCLKFHLSGSLVWPGSPTITIECVSVLINSTFKPGYLRFGAGVGQLEIGANGKFAFYADTPVLTNSLIVGGLMEIYNLVEFQSMNDTDGEIEVILIHSPYGELRLNSLASPLRYTGLINSSASFSTIRARYLIVNGKLDAKVVDVYKGFDRLSIGSYGNLTFSSISDFLVHDLYVNGTMVSKTSIILRGKSKHKIQVLHVESAGRLTLDQPSQNTRVWSGISTVAAHIVNVDGYFFAGKMQNHWTPDAGWDSLTIGPRGVLKFEPFLEFRCDYLSTEGTFDSITPISIQSHQTQDNAYFHIKQKGTVIFESQSRHPLGPWTDMSNFTAKTLIIDSTGQMLAGRAKFKVVNATIGGTLNSQPTDVLEITYFYVTNGGVVNFTTTAHLLGREIGIEGNGIIDVAYKLQPSNHSEGSTSSLVEYASVTVNGRLQAGSLTIQTLSVTVGGTIDVSEGGFLSERGPGAGISYSSGASGGSNGGRGGRGRTSLPYTLARLPYSSIFNEGTWGSGGGKSDSINGGRGGGKLYIYSSQNVVVGGTMLVNGENSKGSHAGGGAGGSIYIKCKDFAMTGRMYSNGGSGSGMGGGGSGGRINIFFEMGRYQSNLVEAKGGAGAEPGGPGIAYFHGSHIRNLRIDNKCQKPIVTEPSGNKADYMDYQNYIYSGAIAYLLPPQDDFTYDFTQVELYGGAHLTFGGNRTTVITMRLFGDDTGHIHIPPYHTLKLLPLPKYHRLNVTYVPYVYENATWILPDSVIEFRQSLDEKSSGINTASCDTSFLNSNTLKIWGNIIGDDAQLLIATGITMIMEDRSPRTMKFSNITIQDGAILQLKSYYGDETDQWEMTIKRSGRVGMLTIEGGGKLIARNLHATSDIVKVDAAGILTLNGAGLTGGAGTGSSTAGGGYGGQGGLGSNKIGKPGDVHGSLYTPDRFGSGGSSASVLYGTGGGKIRLDVSQILIVEGIIEANGVSGTTNIGGGSGGSILIDTRDFEGSGIIQAYGGNGGGNTGAGGGGRIGIYYRKQQWWTGVLNAKGGTSNYGPAGAGTIYMEDTLPNMVNHTLIVDNFGQYHPEPTTNEYSLLARMAHGGMTWIHDNSTGAFNILKVVRGAHLGLMPNLTRPYEFRPYEIIGDSTGVIHIGPGQMIRLQHPEGIEFMTNIYVYHGGTMVLPMRFECYKMEMHIWGTVVLKDLVVSSGCKVFLGREGTSYLHGETGTPGTYRFGELIVEAGGEITVTKEATQTNNKIDIQADTIRVRGGGHVHAVHININSATLIVDDLGRIVGDFHSIPCITGDGYSGSGASGAGHGGYGGRGNGQSRTGMAMGQLFDPVDRGCHGGGNSGGRGGGFIRLMVTQMLQNDGHIICNGENGKAGGGGGSGGSINIKVNLIKGYGRFQAIGGDGSISELSAGGAGSGGRMALYFADNKTFSGYWDMYGGLAGGHGAGNGSPGTAFFYHSGFNHSTLLINNNNRGPSGNSGIIKDYSDLSQDEGHAWFLSEHGSHVLAGNDSYHFNELQIYGHAHLAVITNPVYSQATLLFDSMIGDRTGAIHVGKNQVMDLLRDKIDLPFSVHVYDGGYLGMAPDTNIHGVDIFLNGTLANVKNLTIHHSGKLWLNRQGHTLSESASFYAFDFVHVKNKGYLHMISDPVSEPGISFTTIGLTVDGGGLVRGTHLYFYSTNITIDAGGVISVDGLGYELADGTPTHTNGSFRVGLHGQINPGIGFTGSAASSGAGHGGSGGRGKDLEKGGIPYGDIYEPTLFGSSGGGPSGGAGGGRIWLNVTNTIYIDGLITASGANGVTSAGNAGGGGSGGSIWLHCNTISGYGKLLARGGNGSYFIDSIGNELYGGGGGGGRIAMYFKENTTFSEFRYLANGGWPGMNCNTCEGGGPGTVFLYHMIQNHRTLIIDNDNVPAARNKYVNWEDISNDGGRAWILPLSGHHRFASSYFVYEFEELQIYGHGHLAVLPPKDVNVFNVETSSIIASISSNSSDYNVTIHFRYTIGDRTGSIHIGKNQYMNLLREEIDLPFNCYVYNGAYLGLAPVTLVHDVEIHLSGILANIQNLTLHHGGYLWLKHGGRTPGEDLSNYKFEYMRIQDDAVVNATTDPIMEPGITFIMKSLTVEGGGIMHGTHLTMLMENITVDGGGKISADGLGYNFFHRHETHGQLSLHGRVNPGLPDEMHGMGCGAGHGGSGGKQSRDSARAGFAYGDIYEPDRIGSAGGSGISGKPGGTGGGVIWFNVTGVIDVDGVISADGGNAEKNSGSGGGSGGSIWMYCNLIKGFGKITTHGGDGSNGTSFGSGGAGGRIALYYNYNETMSSFRYQAYGGKAGDSSVSENGGGGTVFIYSMTQNHTTLIIDNGGLSPRNKFNIINNYHNLSFDSCRTWILPESGLHLFAKSRFTFSFDELQIYGKAHLAILPDEVDTAVDLFFLYMIGDRTGTVHLGNAQVFDLERDEIDLPFSVRVYRGGFLGLGPFTVVHGVSIWLHGTLAHVENITLHHNGLLSLEDGGRTEHLPSSSYEFQYVRIQDNSTISAIIDPVLQSGIFFEAHKSIFIEGGGTFLGTNITVFSVDIIIDDGGSLHADALGYRTEDTQTESVNIGLGVTSSQGSSGAGHGGTSGLGAGTSLTGQPYGHLYQPYAYGSAGGGGRGIGGNGGGMLWLNVSNVLEIDGEIRANGGNATGLSGGGGSGGSIWIYTHWFKGMGDITANGGSQYAGGTGGGGAAGRIAIYFNVNQTYRGTYQAHGGYAEGNAEPGGPGTVFLYHQRENHTTLYINNFMRKSKHVRPIKSYKNISDDSFKAWLMPDAARHWLTSGVHDYRFDEFQIYGNAHFAVLPKPFEAGSNLYFKHMIGDRTGFIHIGKFQRIDLRRHFVDTPFSSYIYEGGYLGLAPETNLEKVFVHVEGTLDHIVNLTLIAGGELRMFLTGSTNNRSRLNYYINGTTVIKARSSINASSPNAHSDQYNIVMNTLIVEGGGIVRGSNMKITATDLIIDDGGEIDVSDGGYVSQQGPAPGLWHRLGSSGGSHGGFGGRGACGGFATCKLKRNLPYGDLYRPYEYGSGGGGVKAGRGGGVLELDVKHTLTVDGFIKANSLPVVSSSYLASGGSAGSILINTVNFTGSHTGHIQALGGDGDPAGGGGGSGGRIALYHSRHHTIPPFRGSFDVYGGKGQGGSEVGASGTVYIEDYERNHVTLQVDNKQQKSISEHTSAQNEGYRLDLSVAPVKYSKSNDYMSDAGHHITSSSNVYDCNLPSWCPYSNDGASYLLANLFDQTLGSHPHQYFMAWSSMTTITITLNRSYFINKIKIYPINSSIRTKFQITGYLSSMNFPVTTAFVMPPSSITEGSYLDLPLMRTAEKFVIELQAFNDAHPYASLSEIEIFAGGENIENRYEHLGLSRTSTWIHAKNKEHTFVFNEMRLLGQSHLYFKSLTGLMDSITVDVGQIVGDKTGYLHVGYNQHVSLNTTDSDIPFNCHVYESGSIQYPQRAFFYKTKLASSGHVSGLDDVYVFDGGSVTVDTNGSIGLTHFPGTVSLKSLHVQDKGTFEMRTYSVSHPFSMDATNISIYGGGHFKVNTGLNMTVHHLFAIYSGGLLNLDGAGYQPNTDFAGPGSGTDSTLGASGGGHGGSGGRGAALTTVGLGYDFIFTPKMYGSPGGYGKNYGFLYFGDEPYGNNLVVEGLGGRGGGRVTLKSRHVEIDGGITADGMNPDARFDDGAGKLFQTRTPENVKHFINCCILCFVIKRVPASRV
ncbi:hypothetical protein CHS0354_004945 [Potamilus streckersoni]|uniref:F5/8 type C domain-containing protein n=1 Tax=Potamilus streckersoni TaxID=2493646 RepID=A0AAE0VGE8_9BIVA|nr:hypothetical protein CHS0354_004945 [Potamilus streckersoni]